MYNPSQPRVPAGDHYGGRWTSTGTGGGPAGGVHVASSAMVRGLPHLGAFSPAMVPALRGLLARLPFAAAGPIGVLGALLVPSTQGNVTEGVLPSHPDIVYRYDEGVLTLWQNVPGDRKPLLFHGFADEDGLSRLPDGTIIGRDLGDGVFLNEAAAEIEKRRREVVRGRTTSKSDEPEICPAPTKAPKNNNNEDWRRYQEYVTGLSSNDEVVFRGVRFDGCRNEPGRVVFLEAKGRYSQFIEKDGSGWKYWYDDPDDVAKQMQAQSVAANGRRVEWHVAEKRAADFFRKMARKLRCDNIDVIEDTPPWEIEGK